jgi:hypothetical protein
MKNELQVFENTALLATLRASEKDGIVWFVAKDVSIALGYSETARMLEHCKQSTVLVELNKINSLAPATKWIPESDLYRCIMRSNKAEAEPFQDWVTGQVLPSIRKTGSYSAKTAKLPSFADAVAGVEAVANYLRLSESGRIAFIKPVIEQYGVAIQLPVYAIDAPPSLAAVSSMPTNSATSLLKDSGLGMSAGSFNKILESLGIVETLTRKSSKGDKAYKSVTQYGLIYGKNLTSPSNAKETQPHWYIHKFSELLNLVMNKHAANLKLQ